MLFWCSIEKDVYFRFLSRKRIIGENSNLDKLLEVRWHGRGGQGAWTASELLAQKRESILRLADLHGARNVRVFGSVARGDASEESDVDFLVDMEEGRTLLDLVGFWQDLQDLLGRQVDVISEGGISPYLRGRILAEAVPL